jgi:hypothetical protein
MTDQHYIHCIGFGKRHCASPRQPNSAYCPECRNALEGTLLTALVARLSAHIRQALVEQPCVSCGDPSLTVFCPACTEAGEARKFVTESITVRRAA